MESSRPLPVEKNQSLFLARRNHERELKAHEKEHVFEKNKSYFCFMNNRTGEILPEIKGRELSEKNTNIKRAKVYTENALKFKLTKSNFVIAHSDGSIEGISIDDKDKIFYEGNKHLIFMDSKRKIYSREEGEEKLSSGNKDIKKIQVIKKNSFSKRKCRNAKDKYVMVNSDNSIETIFSRNAKKVFCEEGQNFIFIDNEGTVYSQKEGEILSILNKDIEKVQVTKRTTFYMGNKRKRHQADQAEDSNNSKHYSYSTMSFQNNALGIANPIFENNLVFMDEFDTSATVGTVFELKATNLETEFLANNTPTDNNDTVEITAEDISGFEQLLGRPYHSSTLETEFPANNISTSNNDSVEITTEDISEFEKLFGRPYHSSADDMEIQSTPGNTATNYDSSAYRYYGFFEAAPQQSFEDIMKKKIPIIKQ